MAQNTKPPAGRCGPPCSLDEPLPDQVFHYILNLVHQNRQFARQVEDRAGVSPRTVSTLHFLAENGQVSIGKIQGFIHKSASTTSALVDELEEKNLVTRLRSAQDNRVVHVSLTEQGRQVVANVPLEGFPRLRRQLAELPPQRLEEMKAVFEQINTLLDAEVTE